MFHLSLDLKKMEIASWNETPPPTKVRPDYSVLIGIPAYRARVLPGLKAYYTKGLRPAPKNWSDLLKDVDDE